VLISFTLNDTDYRKNMYTVFNSDFDDPKTDNGWWVCMQLWIRKFINGIYRV